MKFYIELTIVNSADISFSVAWSKLYTQLHLAFVEQKDANQQIPYGVSFPEYKVVESKGKRVMMLGSKLRVFAHSTDELQKLELDKWLARTTDYVHVKSPKQVQNVTHYLTVNRYRPKPNVEKVAERFAKHKGIAYDDALQHCQQHKKGWQDYPYIHMKSFSTKTEASVGREFSLCISQTAVEKANQGKFSCYGLSTTSTVPHW